MLASVESEDTEKASGESLLYDRRERLLRKCWSDISDREDAKVLGERSGKRLPARNDEDLWR